MQQTTLLAVTETSPDLHESTDNTMNENVVTKTVTEQKDAHAAEDSAHATPHISIKAETLFEVAHFPVTNSLLTSLIVTVLFVALAINYGSQIKSKHKNLFFYAIHGLINTIYGLFQSVLKDKLKYFFPLLGAFFFFVLLNNWFGLLPGIGSLTVEAISHGEKAMVPLFRGGTADLNTTLALALISVIITQIYGLKFLGPKAHIGKYLNFKSPVDFFVGIFEIISEFSRILSFSFRLFGNVLAGEVLLVILAFLLPSFLSFIGTPMFFMEVFVGFIQALVFSMLTAVFISMAVEHHH